MNLRLLSAERAAVAQHDFFLCHRVLHVAMQAVLQREKARDVIVRGPYDIMPSSSTKLVILIAGNVVSTTPKK